MKRVAIAAALLVLGACGSEESGEASLEFHCLSPFAAGVCNGWEAGSAQAGKDLRAECRANDGELTDGACPTHGADATCVLPADGEGSVRTIVYEHATNGADVTCRDQGGTWTEL